MKFISLTNRECGYAAVSDRDYEYLSQFSWYVKKSATHEYACTGIRDSQSVRTIRLHRLVMNPLPSEHVHHINGDTFNCTRDNLGIIDSSLHGIISARKRDDAKTTV